MKKYCYILLRVLFFFPFTLLSCAAESNDIIEANEIIKEKEEISSCVMIVPDIQNYTHKNESFKYLNAIVDYYHESKDSIDAILQVGDLTNNNQIWQYENAYNQFFSKIGMTDQLVFCLGNHDYGNNGKSDVRSSNFPESMIPPHDIRMGNSQYENYVRYINIGGKRYGVLVLEFCTRNETLEWANEILINDASIPYIILTHVFLDQNGEMFDSTNNLIENKGSSPKKYKMGGAYKNDSREIFDKIIYKNPNVKFVLCGHCLTPNYINVHSENNVEGKPVHMIEVNYQHYKNGGHGYVGILDILENGFRIRSFSTFEKKYGNIDLVIRTNN